MNEFTASGVIACTDSMLDVFDKMQRDTEKLQNDMYEQESLIRGDLIMNQAMELLQEINLTVQKMKSATKKAVENKKNCAIDFADIQKIGSNNAGRI